MHTDGEALICASPLPTGLAHLTKYWLPGEMSSSDVARYFARLPFIRLNLFRIFWGGWGNVEQGAGSEVGGFAVEGTRGAVGLGCGECAGLTEGEE